MPSFNRPALTRQPATDHQISPPDQAGLRLPFRAMTPIQSVEPMRARRCRWADLGDNRPAAACAMAAPKAHLSRMT